MKKFISFVMAFSLMFMLFDLPLDVFAAADATSGNCGDNVTWSYDSSSQTLTISGTGDMANVPWGSYRADIKTVTISSGVTNIGVSAFKGCTALTNITIPDSVTRIGNTAFSGCTSLKSINIPNGVTSIESNAFKECTALTSIDISNTVTAIMGNAFNGCTSLTSINIPNSVTKINYNAFQNCTSLTSITIPKNVKIINANVFQGCSNLKAVEFTSAAAPTTFDADVFKDCDASLKITIPCSWSAPNDLGGNWATYVGKITQKGHDYDTKWKNDATNHWNVCKNCEAKKDEAEHTEGNGTVTVQPTETTAGTRIFKCTVCEYVMRTETIPATGAEHVHDFGTDWKRDTVNHWHECVCGEKSNVSAHTEDSGTVTVQPTETTEGTRTFKCTVCEYVMRTETIPATGVIPVPTPTPVPPSPPVTYPDLIVSPVITADSDEPFIVDNKGIEGWEAISEDINITADGGIVDVDMNGTDILPQDIVENIAGRDIDLVLEMGSGITWTINGLTVTDAQRTNMKVYVDRGRIPNKVLDTVSGGAYVKELTLKHTGEFGFTPVLSLKMPDRFEDKYANLFYYNPKSGEMEFVNFDLIRDGAVKLAFSHASEYAVVVSDAPMGGEDVSAAAGTFGNGGTIGTVSSNYVSYCVIIIAIIGTGIVAVRRRRQK